MRRAFTIIEIFVSIMIISIVILGIAKMAQQSIDMAKYISSRGSNELSNTLFFPVILRGDVKGMQIDGYSAISSVIRIKSDAIKESLKNVERNVTISDSIEIKEDNLPISVDLRAIMIKGDYPSRYYSISLGKVKQDDQR